MFIRDSEIAKAGIHLWFVSSIVSTSSGGVSTTVTMLSILAKTSNIQIVSNINILTSILI